MPELVFNNIFSFFISRKNSKSMVGKNLPENKWVKENRHTN